MLVVSKAVVVASCWMGFVACDRPGEAPKPNPVATAAPQAPSLASTAPPVSTAQSVPAAPSAVDPPPPNRVHCKALGKRGRVALGVLQEPLVGFLSEGDELYTLGYHQPLARVTLSRSSGKAQKLESYKALNPDVRPVDVEILGLAMDEECLYTARQFEKHVELYALARP